MDPDIVPAEMWLDIFELLPAGSDLYHVSQTCKKFQALALRYLYRDITWRTPSAVAQNLPVWDAHPELNTNVRSLVLSVTTNPAPFGGSLVRLGGPFFHRNGTYRFAGLNDNLEHTLRRYAGLLKGTYATEMLNDAMLTRISSFTNLASLTFYSVSVSSRHFAIIHALPFLRSLRLEMCIVNSRVFSQIYDHSTLSITDLTMVNLRRMSSYMPGEQSVDEDITHVLSLALATNLRTLCVDSTADVFRQFFHGLDTTGQVWTIPPNLERLYVQRKGEKQATLPGESSFPDNDFYAFLERARSLRTVSTYHSPGPHHIFPADATALQLTNYAGPLDSISGPHIMASTVQGLVIQKCGNSVREGVAALPMLAEHFTSLKFLAVEFKVWDDEIIHATASLFPSLRRLKITFEGLGPSENKIVSLGPDILSTLPMLHTLQIYSTTFDPRTLGYPQYLFDASYPNIEEELRDLVIPWNRYCQALRHVQLTAWYEVNRTGINARWFVEKLEKAADREEFIY